MSKAIMLSIKPRFVADILNGRKTIEVRKVSPKCDLPITVYIYCTKEKSLIRKGNKQWIIKDKNFVYEDANYYAGFNGKVVAKFTLRKVEEIYREYDIRLEQDYFMTNSLVDWYLLNKCKLSNAELDNYLENKTGYAYHIEDLVIFDEPKELSEFVHKVVIEHHTKGHIGYLVEERFEPLTKAPQNYCFVESEE